MRKAILVAVLLSMVCCVSPANSGDFPSKAITIVCPYGAGGGTDLAARIMGEYATKYLGQSVVIVNKTGGLGTIGMLAALEAPRDGYTLATATADLITIPMLGVSDQISMDTFDIICAVNGEPASIIVRADAPWSTLEEFIADAKKRPGEITLANTGAGNIWHLAVLGLEDAAGVSFNNVPYQAGASAALTGILGGHVDAACFSAAEGASNISTGELKVLAVAGDKRLDAFPDVPTFKEKGIDLVVVALRGVCIPKGAPAEVLTVLRDAFSKAVNDPECKEKVLKANMTYMPLNAQEATDLLNSMAPTFKKAIEIFNNQ